MSGKLLFDFKLVFAAVGLILLTSACAVKNSEKNASTKPAADPASSEESAKLPALTPEQNKKLLAQLDVLPGIGKKSAPVKMILFQDLTCGMCAHFFKNAFPEIKKKYIDTGKVRLEFVEHPLLNTQNSRGLALATLCANQQNAYFPYLSYVYTPKMKRQFSDALEYAKKVKLDVNRFKKCIEKAPFTESINKNRRIGEELRVNGTPTFFINGKEISGSGPFEVYAKEIDSFLLPPRK